LKEFLIFTRDCSKISLLQPGGHGATMGAPTVDPVAVKEGIEGVEIFFGLEL
jgi:hypothetical protein